MNRSHSRRVKEVAVIGFGSQGRAQAVRLKAAGWRVHIGLPARSGSRRLARRAGFPVALPDRAVAGCDTVALLVPDRAASRVLYELAAKLERGTLVVLAAGYPLVFPQHPLPDHLDIVLVAPHGPGRHLEAGEPMSGFVGVQSDVTGRARKRARAYARAIGLKPLIPSRPRDEALGDLFGEQTLLCGGLLGLTAAVARQLIRRGIPPANAYYETTGQLELLASLLARKGVDGFWQEISDCAAFGAARAAPRLFDAQFAGALQQVWNDIDSGRFAREFQKRGRPANLPRTWSVLRDLEEGVRRSSSGGRQG